MARDLAWLRSVLDRLDHLEARVSSYPLIGEVVAYSAVPSPRVSVRVKSTSADEGDLLILDVGWVVGQEFSGLRIRQTEPALGTMVLVHRTSSTGGGLEYVVGGVLSKSLSSDVSGHESDVESVSGVASPEDLDVSRGGTKVLGVSKASGSSASAEGAFLVMEPGLLKLVCEGDFDDSGTLKHGKTVVEVSASGFKVTGPANGFVEEPATNA